MIVPFGLPYIVARQWFNQALKKMLNRIRLQPQAFPNRISEPGTRYGTMGLQPGSPQVPSTPLPPPVAEPDLSALTPSLSAPMQPDETQQQEGINWQRYFNEIYRQLNRRELPPVPQLPLPVEPMQTDWERMLPVALGLLVSPSSVRAGAMAGLANAYLQQEQAKRDYTQALLQRAYQQAELERQRQIAQEQADAQAREDALKLAMTAATDEERRALQQQLAELRARTQLDMSRMQSDMQAVSRHMAIANNPQLPKEQRAAAYQNAAAILSQYGYELPALPTMPSTAERGVALREQIEPQRMEIEKERFNFEKWRGQEQVKQGWKRIEQMQQNIAINAQRLANSVRSQNWKQAQDTLKNISIYHSQLRAEEDSLTKQLNASTKDELGRPIPVYNIPLQRQAQLLAGAVPASPLEAQWQDLALRLSAVRRERQRAAQLLQSAVLPQPAKGNAPVFKTRSGNTFSP